MNGATYQLIIIIVGVIALVNGYRKSFTGQICGLLGMAFGAVCAVIFADPVIIFLKDNFPSLKNYPFPTFVYSTLASALIYFFVYFIIKFFTSVLNSALQVFRIGMFNRILGSVFSFFKFMIPLSIIYNIILCINPNSELLNYAKADDGNMVASVLKLAPAVLDCVNVDELAHAMQLIEAKKISCNFNSPNTVINLEYYRNRKS